MIPRDRGPDGAVPRFDAHWKDSGYKVLNKIGTGPLDQCTVDSVRPGETVTVRCKTGQGTTWFYHQQFAVR